MTLQECKDHVAKKHKFNSWREACYLYVTKNEMQEMVNEIAELYARSKEKEAFDAGFKRGLAENNKPEFKP